MHGDRLHETAPPLDLVLTTAPACDPLDLATVKAHLRYDYDDQDAPIQGLIDTATANLDGYAGYLGRALVTQTWTLYLDRFPWRRWSSRQLTPYGHRELVLPLPPLISVGQVAYSDETGAPQILDPATYTVRAGPRSSISLNVGASWPETSLEPRNVSVPFTCGYGTAAEAPVTAVPAPIRQAMLLMIGDMFENREAVVVAESRVTQVLNPTVDNLLSPLRARWL